jgi:type IV pilus assembly protein PilO
MNTSSAAITTFIDEKYIPLAPRIKLGIMVGIILLPLIVFYFSYYQQKAKKIQNLNQQKASLTQQLQEVKRKASDLAKFEKEMKEAEDLFFKTAVLLPKEKEIPKLLKDISALGQTAGLDFLTFKPLADIPKDFYAEIPVTINVRGPYHNMGSFFDQVSKLERIVSVSNIKMSSPKKKMGKCCSTRTANWLRTVLQTLSFPNHPKSETHDLFN